MGLNWKEARLRGREASGEAWEIPTSRLPRVTDAGIDTQSLFAGISTGATGSVPDFQPPAEQNIEVWRMPPWNEGS